MVAKIITLVGQAGSGKSTVTDFLMDRLCHKVSIFECALADPFKEGLHAIFETPRDELWGPSEKRRQPVCDVTSVSIRTACQTLGTAWGQKVFGKEIWCKLAWRYARTLPNDAILIISDVRFLHELSFFYRKGAQQWRLRRKPRTALRSVTDRFPILYKIGAKLSSIFPNTPHPSEYEMWTPQADRYINEEIDNTGTKDYLEAQVEGLIERMTMMQQVAKVAA